MQLSVSCPPGRFPRCSVIIGSVDQQASRAVFDVVAPVFSQLEPEINRLRCCCCSACIKQKCGKRPSRMEDVSLF